MKHTAILAFYSYGEILVSLLCLFFPDRNFDLRGDLNYFALISLPVACGRTVSGFSIPAFQQEVAELTLGGRRRHRHPRGAAVHGERGAGCAAGVVAEVARGNPAWEAARKDARPRGCSGRRARLGSSELSSPGEGGFSSVLHTCCTNEAEKQVMLSLLFTPVQIFLDSPHCGRPGGENIHGYSSGELLFVIRL